MSDSAAPGLPGRVVAAYGGRVVVEDADGATHPCVLRGRRLRAVCGDRVRWTPPPGDGDGIVLAIEPRSNALQRPDSRGRTEVLAANVTQLIAVCAPKPPPDPALVDRHLAAAELMPCKAFVLCNKIDLDDSPEPPAWTRELERAGYGVLRTSVRTDAGLDALRRTLEGHTSILVGQSGVGKSSLLNALVPGLSTATAMLSAVTGMGKHTTSAAVLHRLPSGGAIIDSPGVRDHAPPPIPPREVQRGFIELAEPALDCRFADCLHRGEPGCGVKAAVADGRITARRYESYLALLRLMESFTPAW
jgi:ribosome biogenesis GTPase